MSQFMMSTGKELGSSLPTRSNYLNALPSYWSATLYPDRHSSHRQIIDYDGGLLAVEVEKESQPSFPEDVS